jgi:hypothetical protein
MMEYTAVSNPRWNKEHTQIVCDVTFVQIGTVPFSAALGDLPHSVEIYERCMAGEFGPIAEYVPAPDEAPQTIPDAVEGQPSTVEGAQTL